MLQQKVRVLIASEYPATRHLLSQVAEEEPEVTVVGQAGNGIKTITLARNLRPDIALIDFGLPYMIGLDNVSLSRISGLDVALSISEELPSTRVILLGNMEAPVYGENGLAGEISLYRDTAAESTRFTLRELYDRGQQETLVFASVVSRQRVALGEKVVKISEGAMLYGGLGADAHRHFCWGRSNVSSGGSGDGSLWSRWACGSFFGAQDFFI